MSSASLLRQCLACASIGLTAFAASAAPLYFNGFETDTTSWTNANRVASGTGGITSASGAFHATAGTGSVFTTFGGYNYGAGNNVPTVFQPYSTAIDIYLDLTGGLANNTRFDFSSAISNAAGAHKRDFIFNAGFYNDATGPGANTDRFVVSASNNSQPGNAYAQNPARDPIAISASGWYTFQHTFYDDAGVLAVEMEIFDSSSTLLNSWILSDPADTIATVGGSRYGWFSYNQIAGLAFDNSRLDLTVANVPEPATLLLVGASLLGLAASRRRRA